LWWGVVAIVGGARLGHVFFYEPITYLQNPIEILKFWKGGLASHGATVGLMVALWGFGRKYDRTFRRLGDYLAPAIAIAAGGVRIGNFFNSEIVGRVTDVEWGVRFIRYCRIEGIAPDQCLPRHPSQMYEFLMGVTTFAVLMFLQKLDIRRAGSGFIAGVFLILYFSFRFTVEFFKEFQTEELRTQGPLGAIEEAMNYHFTMGQWLSVIPVLMGVYLLVTALRQPKDAMPEPVPTLEA
jgi:prolipoprotein diacylglyceryl transferase